MTSTHMHSYELPLQAPATHAEPLSLSASLGHAALHLVETLYSWQQRAMERQQLRQMDDHLLKDMGISRADVEYEASKPFWRV